MTLVIIYNAEVKNHLIRRCVQTFASYCVCDGGKENPGKPLAVQDGLRNWGKNWNEDWLGKGTFSSS